MCAWCSRMTICKSSRSDLACCVTFGRLLAVKYGRAIRQKHFTEAAHEQAINTIDLIWAEY
jgi:hypothetical protein